MEPAAATASEYAVWRGNDNEILFVPYEYGRVLPFERWWNSLTVHTFFLHHWSLSIWIALVYVVLIHSLQRLLATHKPLELRGALFLWNASLAIFSFMGTWRFGEEFVYMLTTRPFTHSVCYSVNPEGPAAVWACAFAFSKIAELFDTLFLVLRKRPVIFLHWYHHAVVLIYSWHSAVELTAAGRHYIFMNYFVHTVMYSYYAATALGYRFPKAVAMTVTTLQTSQMLIGVGISIYVLQVKLRSVQPCQQSFDNLAMCWAIYSSFALLFSRFFIRAYLTPKSKTKAE